MMLCFYFGGSASIHEIDITNFFRKDPGPDRSIPSYNWRLTTPGIWATRNVPLLSINRMDSGIAPYRKNKKLHSLIFWLTPSMKESEVSASKNILYDIFLLLHFLHPFPIKLLLRGGPIPITDRGAAHDIVVYDI